MDDGIPTEEGNGRVYAQQEAVVRGKTIRLTARDAGPLIGNEGATPGTRLLEVVRCDVDPKDGSPSNHRVIFRTMLLTREDSPIVRDIHADFLIDAAQGTVYFGQASGDWFGLVAFGIDATPFPKDCKPRLDTPLPPDVTQAELEASMTKAVARHVRAVRPTFDGEAVFVIGIQRLDLERDGDKVVMVLKVDSVVNAPGNNHSNPEVRFTYVAGFTRRPCDSRIEGPQ